MPKVGQSTVYGTIVPKLSTLKKHAYGNFCRTYVL